MSAGLEARERPPVHRRRRAARYLHERLRRPLPTALSSLTRTAKLRRLKVSDPGQEGLADAFVGFADVSAPTSGVVDTAFGQATFVAIPVSVGDRSGVLLAASLTAAERDQVESAVRIAIGVSIVVLLLASLFIWLALLDARSRR